MGTFVETDERRKDPSCPSVLSLSLSATVNTQSPNRSTGAVLDHEFRLQLDSYAIEKLGGGGH